MSDSFANLWNTSAGTGPKPAQRTLGGTLAAQPAPAVGSRRPGPDAFSILASSSKPNQSSTPITRSRTPASSSSTPPSKPPSRGSNDAFSGLLAGTGTFSGAGSEAGMSMAARAARVEADRRAALERQKAASKQQNAAWAGLDALGIPTVAPISPSNDDDDWLFGSATSPASTRSPPSAAASPPPPKSVRQAEDWGLDDFISAPAQKPTASSSTTSPATVQKSTKPAGGSFWDLDALDSAPAPITREAPSRSRTPGDFDFGDREDGLSQGDSGDEQDILGALARPVSERRPPPRASSNAATRSSRRHSPPPHLIGQIVEMGYTLEQARVALAATDSGEDVQAAIEILLSGGTPGPAPAPAPSNGASRRDRDEDDGWGDARRRRFNYEDDDDEGPPRRAPPRTTAAPPAASPPARPGVSRTSSSTREREGEGIQADKLIAQASEIGISVFNRANALWKSGKEQAKKLYEEQQAARAAAAAASGSAPPRKDGRPKWMQDAAAEDGEIVPPARRREQTQDAPAFVDDDAPAPAPQRRPRPTPAEASPSGVPPTGDLFSDAPAEPPARQYRRRHSPPRTRNPTPAARNPAPPSAPALITRQTISATPAAIAASERHKSSGTEMFKLGRYAEAESSYTSAISTLPDNHLLLLPLLNNRAAARFKIGDTAGAIADSTTVITLVGTDYRPGTEKKVERKEEGAGVDLGLALVKAWKRRAESFEGREKWAEALGDWERVAGCEFAGALRREGVTGAARCRKATAPAPSSVPKPTAPKTKPKPAALRPPARPAPPSEAASRLKQANAEAEAEDNAKYELKDSVEARITAWKGGKETNIRALISSLENVLWPELGWAKVGMGELLTPAQVKIRYTKAIAKLHPDKLNARNTTVEQRMIANGVFSALNDAWNAFQQAS